MQIRRTFAKILHEKVHGRLRPGLSAFTIIKPELVRGAGNEKLKAGLVGCGGRGTQAAQQLLHGNENVELVAMGDIFEDQLEASLDQIRNSKYYGMSRTRSRSIPSIISWVSTPIRKCWRPTSIS